MTAFPSRGFEEERRARDETREGRGRSRRSASIGTPIGTPIEILDERKVPGGTSLEVAVESPSGTSRQTPRSAAAAAVALASRAYARRLFPRAAAAAAARAVHRPRDGDDDGAGERAHAHRAPRGQTRRRAVRVGVHGDTLVSVHGDTLVSVHGDTLVSVHGDTFRFGVGLASATSGLARLDGVFLARLDGVSRRGFVVEAPAGFQDVSEPFECVCQSSGGGVRASPAATSEKRRFRAAEVFGDGS